MFTDVSVAFKGTEHSVLLANCFPPAFQDKLPLRLLSYLFGLWWQPLLLTFFLGDEADPFGGRAAQIIVGYHPQLVGGVGLETPEAGSQPWPSVLCLGLAGSTGGG